MRRGKMDVKEIEINERHIQDIYLAGTKEQFRTLSLSLLSLLSEKDKEVETLQISINSYIEGIYTNLEERQKLHDRIKELEKINESFRENAETLYDFWQGAEAKIKKLEEQLRISREAHADTMNGQARKIKELEARRIP